MAPLAGVLYSFTQKVIKGGTIGRPECRILHHGDYRLGFCCQELLWCDEINHPEHVSEVFHNRPKLGAVLEGPRFGAQGEQLCEFRTIRVCFLV